MKETFSAVEIVSIVFLLCAVFAFIMLLFANEKERWQKIFGSLVILISALISENGWALSIAVVIGGLIVASEDFMRFVTAIFRSNPDKIADTISAFKTERASKKEVDDKLKQDSREELEIVPATEEPVLPTSRSEKAREKMARVRKVEELVQSYLQENIKGYESHVKIIKGDSSIVVDGVIRRKSGKIGAVIEIRYITARSFPILKNLIFSFYGKLTRCGIHKRALIPVVSEEMTVEAARTMYEENKGLASLMFFKLKENELELIDLKNLGIFSSNF